MTPSSTKNHLIIKVVLLLFFSSPFLVSAAKYQYQLEFDARYATHTKGPPDIASHRHTFGYEQKAQYNNEWSSVLGLRAEVEAAYSAHPERYGSGDVGKNDSQSFFPRDNYLQYQGDYFRLRAGYQQVVWGEAFGSYYADIVNPKDYREAGLGNLSRNRLDSPILNLQWIFSTTSFQMLYIPKASLSLFPSAGSDFNTLQPPSSVPGSSLLIERNPQDALTRGEYGARLTQQISSFDLSLFYLNYYDRLPVYSITLGSTPGVFVATPDFRPLQTSGLTVTSDFSGYLLRIEALQNTKREFNTFDETGLGTDKSDEFVYVLGLDLPSFDKWQLGLQSSASQLREGKWSGREKTQSIASVRLAKTFENGVGAEALFTQFNSDSSALTQIDFVFPLSNQTELIFGADQFSGSDNTYMGRLKDASRAWVMFKASIKK